MRVISQNGKTDIPYEYFVFSIVGKKFSKLKPSKPKKLRS